MTYLPTPEQAAIIEAARSSEKSIMAFALAGTGKTSTLKMAAPHLPTKSILALAFNKKTASELEEALPPHCVVRSFNALGHRAYASATGRRLTLDDRKIAKLTTAYCKKLGGVSDDEWSNISSLVKRARLLGLVPARYPQARKGLLSDDSFGWEIAADSIGLDLSEQLVVGAREVLSQSIDLAQQGNIDYDDQIYMSCLFAGLYQKFHTVICDESQDISDLNRMQIMKSASHRIIAVGDPKQAIYAFRGATSDSMACIKRLKPDWLDLPLTVTWRCPKAIVARQQSHAPGYTAAPEAPEGEVFDLREEKQWTISPQGLMPNAILCRNNAPLISMAFALIRKRIGIKVLGRDFGKSLTMMVKKVAGERILGVEEFVAAFREWYDKQCRLALAANKEEKIDRLRDQYESIMAVVESGGKDITAVHHIITALELLFESPAGQIILSTGHKAKGLEWHTVLHLDPWRIPSKWARLAADDGNGTPLEQEYNLQYVIETRAKNTLILANLEQFV